MATKTVFIDGQNTVVNANNWRTLARLKLDETLRANPNASNAEQLAIFRGFQELGGGGDAFTQVTEGTTARFNDFGASKVLNNPFVKAADAAEVAERSVIGQDGVNALHRISDTTVAQVKASFNFVTDKIPAAGKHVAGFFSGLSSTVKFASVAIVAAAALLIVYKVKK